MSTATENRNLRTPTDIPANAVTPLARQLNVTLANLLALYLKTKNFHWHVSGPHFRDYHLLLDDQATDIFNAVDEIAERVRKIGATTLRSIGDVTRHQTLKDNDAEFVAARDMLLELREDNLHLVEDLRAAKQLADDAKDNATSALIDEWTDQAEKRVWFLFESARP